MAGPSVLSQWGGGEVGHRDYDRGQESVMLAEFFLDPSIQESQVSLVLKVVEVSV